jgi:hypothetical protein
MAERDDPSKEPVEPNGEKKQQEDREDFYGMVGVFFCVERGSRRGCGMDW